MGRQYVVMGETGGLGQKLNLGAETIMWGKSSWL